MMKKIILYGLRHIELRRNIEYFLGDDYKIIGYSDTWYKSDVIDGKRFIPPQEICKQAFDYILPLSFRESTLSEMRSALLDVGVSPEKIIKPLMFMQKNAEKMQLDLVRDIDECYLGEPCLIFGLSYSIRGIENSRLQIPAYNCAWHSLDLYYNYKLFLYMQGRGLLPEKGTALLVLPYYIFDYDLSRSLYNYQMGYTFPVWRLDDWHHYQNVPDGADYVANYRMFGQKISAFYHFKRYQLKNYGIYQGCDGAAELGKLWFCNHEETAVENMSIFSLLCRELMAEKITPVLIVPPFYLRGVDSASLKAVDAKRNRFYQLIEETGIEIKILDYMDIYSDKRELFMDITHLNADGATAFTERINTDVFENI